MNALTLDPIAMVDGIINLPGSKSVSNRVLLLAALAEGTTVLTNLLAFGRYQAYARRPWMHWAYAVIISGDKTRCEVRGLGGPFGKSREPELFLGNAGTAMRPSVCGPLSRQG